MFPQTNLTKFEYFYDMLVAVVPSYEAKHGYPLLVAAGLWRILYWKLVGGNTFTIASCPDSMDKMVNDYLNHVYSGATRPFWLAQLEG